MRAYYVARLDPIVARIVARVARALVLEFGEACGRWIEAYDKDRSKIHSFVERYDLIASDARMLTIGPRDGA